MLTKDQKLIPGDIDYELKRIIGKIGAMSHLFKSDRARDLGLEEEEFLGAGDILDDISAELKVIKEALYPSEDGEGMG